MADWFRKAGEIWGQADRALGGWLPGGAESPLGRTKRRVASAAFNQLDDRVNLFGRYLTGFGNTGLELDKSTLESLRYASRPTPKHQRPVEGGPLFDERGQPMLAASVPFEEYGPFLPETSTVDPYPMRGVGKDVTQTLGTYKATADPKENTLRIQDTYDMVNRVEDRDLVSGKFQPGKAWNEIEAIWNPAAGVRNLGRHVPAEFQRGYTMENVQQGLKGNAFYDKTHSPLTRAGRALMYLLPAKFTPYEVDVTIPMSGPINQ